MNRKKISYPPINMGTSLMLVIFLILCMVIFAVLSLSSSLKDKQYSEKNALRTACFYEACNLAEERLAQIDTILLQTASANARLSRLQALEAVTVTEASSQLTIQYQVPLDEDEILQVTLTCEPQGNQRYTIQSWKQMSITEWKGNETLPVLGNELQ